MGLANALQSRSRLTYGFIAFAIITFIYFSGYTPKQLPTASLARSRQSLHTQEVTAASSQPSPLAQEVTAASLIARGTTKDVNTLPKILHQSWKNNELPDDFKGWSATCRRKNPDWQWVLWTNEDNRNLVKTHFPWLLEVYDGFTEEIFRADLARNLYMYLFGGIYSDLDVECLRPYQVVFDSYNVTTIPYSNEPHAPILSTDDPRSVRTAFFGRMGPLVDLAFSIPNAWMAATPGHPFFLLPLEFASEKFKNKESMDKPEELTGPDALYSQISDYTKKYKSPSSELDEKLAKSSLKGLFEPQSNAHRMEIVPHPIIFPFCHVSEQENHDVCWAVSDSHDAEACKRGLHVDLRGSVTISYWRHSW